MAKKVVKLVKLQVLAGKATPAPPVGPALGQAGVNIMAFVKEFNERAGIEKASGEPNKKKVAKLPRAEAMKIAESKMQDLNAADIEAATRMIEGTARSMGIEIVD